MEIMVMKVFCSIDIPSASRSVTIDLTICLVQVSLPVLRGARTRAWPDVRVPSASREHPRSQRE